MDTTGGEYVDGRASAFTCYDRERQRVPFHLGSSGSKLDESPTSTRGHMTDSPASRLAWRALLCCVVLTSCDTQRSADAELPLPSRPIEFTTTEGSWMSVDVSPDGATIVFDLLGQLYTIPAAGGTATPLAHHEWAWDANPRFSPDGK